MNRFDTASIVTLAFALGLIVAGFIVDVLDVNPRLAACVGLMLVALSIAILLIPLVVLSLGAGVQSTTLALMAAHGENRRCCCSRASGACVAKRYSDCRAALWSAD